MGNEQEKEKYRQEKEKIDLGIDAEDEYLTLLEAVRSRSDIDIVFAFLNEHPCHELWEVLAAFGSEHLDAFALTAWTLAGRFGFPSSRYLEAARNQFILRPYSDYEGIKPTEIVQKVYKERHIPMTPAYVSEKMRELRKKEEIGPPVPDRKFEERMMEVIRLRLLRCG
jgi:hypothetical protein